MGSNPIVASLTGEPLLRLHLLWYLGIGDKYQLTDEPIRAVFVTKGERPLFKINQTKIPSCLFSLFLVPVVWMIPIFVMFIISYFSPADRSVYVIPTEKPDKDFSGYFLSAFLVFSILISYYLPEMLASLSVTIRRKMDTYLPIYEVANTVQIPETYLFHLTQVGKIRSIKTRDGEVLVNENDIKAQISKDPGLMGHAISINEASRKYHVAQQTISRWKDRGRIRVLGTDGQKVLLDEADVDYEVRLYLINPGKGRRTDKMR